MTADELGDGVSTTAQVLTEPETLLRLVEDSGYGFAVIEDSIEVLKRRVGHIDLEDNAVTELLKAHLRAVGSPTAVGKFFSFELLCRINEGATVDVSLEVCRLLAGMDLIAERAYPIERELMAYLGQHKILSALPVLAVIASKNAGEVSRSAARAAVVMVGSRRKDAMKAALEDLESPESAPAAELSQALVDALNRRRLSREETNHGMARAESGGLTLIGQQPLQIAGDTSTRTTLRPERRRERDNRLRAIIREAGRNPGECGNCGLVGPCRVTHVIPENRGGTDRAGNLAVYCRQCARRFSANRRDSSSVRRRLEQLTTDQLSLFEEAP
jgi:5-methylcytosine-specific restriction endonuclease McrA